MSPRSRVRLVAVFCCLGLFGVSSVPIGSPGADPRGAGGGILSAVVKPLRFIQREAFAQEAGGEVTASHVHQTISDLISEIEVLREAMGVTDYPPEAEPQEDRAPTHAYAKTLEVLEKISAAQRRLGIAPVKTGQIPVKVIEARDVLDSVNVALAEVRKIKNQLVIEDPIQPAPLEAGKTHSLVYQLLGDASFLMDGLVGHPTDIGDVYRNLCHLQGDMELVADRLEVALELEPPSVEPGRKMREVAQQLLRGSYKIVNVQTRLGIDASGVPQMTLVRISPAELYEVANVLNAEMVRIKAHLGIESPHEECVDARNKNPGDVFALALLINRSLDQVAKAAARAAAPQAAPQAATQAAAPQAATTQATTQAATQAATRAAPETPAEASGGELVKGSISESTTWRSGGTYLLDGLVYVESGVHLVIEPGVTVLGGQGAALIVTRGGLLQARGRANAPVVFTSAKPVEERASGDWGGVVLLGGAPINRGTATVEGVLDVTRASFGGDDPAWNCGLLEYVRIEFAGYAIGANNELNGLTLGGCGNTTLIDHVQVHRGHDDGVEIFGGTVDLKHVLVSHARDDSFDWDMGWTGRAQFLIVQQHPDVGNNGFEGDNWKQEPSAQPISQPRIYNVTMVGSRNPGRSQRAMVIRNGSGGEFGNILLTGFPLEAIDLRGPLTAERVESKALSFGGIAMSHVGPDGVTPFMDESAGRDDDGGFDEQRYFAEVAPDILLNAPEALGPDAWSLTHPDFTPVAGDAGAGSSLYPPADDEDFWDESASYYGAVPFGQHTNWTSGWTAFPES